MRWGSEADYDAASGMSQENNQPVSDAKELMASRATSILNAWVVRMVHATFDDELKEIGVPFPQDDRQMLFSLLLADPKTLKTYDETLGDSILFDDLTTTDVVETRDDRILVSLLDALDFLSTRLGADRNGWQWGRLHTIRFEALISLWSTLSIPADRLSGKVFVEWASAGGWGSGARGRALRARAR